MGSEDCSALVIGCLASPTANRSPKYVEAYKQISDIHFDGTRRVLNGIMAFKEDSKSAFDFLTSLIESASDGRLVAAMNKIAAKNYGEELPLIEITFSKPAPKMRVIFRKRRLGDILWHATFEKPYLKKIDGSLIAQRGGVFGMHEFFSEPDSLGVDALILKDKQDREIFGKYIEQGECDGVAEEVTITHRTIFGLGALIR